MKLLGIQKIKYYQEIPWYMGLVAWDPKNYIGRWIAPVPINFIYRTVYLVYNWIRYPFSSNLVEERKFRNERTR